MITIQPTRAKSLVSLLPALGFALLLGACASVATRPAALDDARAAVDAARANPQVTTYAAGELQEAVAAYDKAEALFRKEGDTAEVRHLGYMARERAAIAQETAQLRRSEQAVANATAERERVRLEARAAEANTAQRQARLAEMQAEAARAAAADAQQRAEAARQQATLAQSQVASARQQARTAQERNAVLEAELRELYATKSDRGLVVTLNDVLFDSGSATLRPGGRRVVAKLGSFLREYPERTIAIEGFTDSVGDDSYNQALSERRAVAVQTALVEEGIAADRIYVRGYGEAFPVASNDTPEGRQRNRRVEVVISDERGAIGPRLVTYLGPLH